MRGSQFFMQLLRDDRGATAIEYGLILALICLAILASIQALAGEVIETWTNVESASTDAMDGPTVPMD
jgi:pilus assembly protein Flp/PilA